MPIILLLKGWKFVLEILVQLLEYIIKYCQAQPQPTFDNQMNDGTEEEMLENIMPNGNGDGKIVVVFLAIEVWVDVLGFVKRVELARTVCLTNRHIHQICWPRLHGNKVMAHPISEIFIGSRDELGRTPMALLIKDGKEVPIPKCPMPIYIAGFHQIRICFLDEEVLAFFKLISHCIAANPYAINIYNLQMSKMEEKQRTNVNELLQIFREKKSSAFRLLSCRMADIQYIQHVDNQTSKLYLELEGYPDLDILNIPHLMEMLASPRPDGKQRVIYLSLSDDGKKELLNTIKQEFRASTQAVPQPFCLYFYAHGLDIPNSEELKPQTGETLMIVRNGQNDKIGIYRHPMGQYAQWAEDARNGLNRRMESTQGFMWTFKISEIRDNLSLIAYASIYCICYFLSNRTCYRRSIAIFHLIS